MIILRLASIRIKNLIELRHVNELTKGDGQSLHGKQAPDGHTIVALFICFLTSGSPEMDFSTRSTSVV